MIALVEVLKRTEAFLRAKGVDSPRLDAELILAKHLGVERLQLYLIHDRPMSEAELAPMRADVARRGQREPIYWILGQRSFHDIVLGTPRDVLVPRPDTETLVSAALELMDPEADPLYVADVGCGTGAIGLSIAHALPGARVYCTDLSDQAIAATRANVARLELGQRVAVLQGDLLDPIPARRPIDWVLSNPPYIPSADLDGLMPEVSVHEPRLALDGGSDGLDVYRRLVPEAVRRARRGVLLEVGMGQADAVAELLKGSGLQDVRTWRDLNGIERVVGAIW